jgi:hypothetical protein
MFENKINPAIGADNTRMTIAKASGNATPTESPIAMQNSTYRKNFPHYRLGTSDAIKIDLLLEQDQSHIDLREVEGSVVGHISIWWEIKKAEDRRGTWRTFSPNALQEGAFKEFWDRADDLASSYLTRDEFRSYTQSIPAGSGSDFLLKENDNTEGGGGSGG